MAVANVGFTLLLGSRNEAVVSDPYGSIARALDQVSALVYEGATAGVIRDTNGNKIGNFSLLIEEEDDD